MQTRFPDATLALARRRLLDPAPGDTPFCRRRAIAMLTLARRDRLAENHPLGPRPPYAAVMPLPDGDAA